MAKMVILKVFSTISAAEGGRKNFTLVPVKWAKWANCEQIWANFMRFQVRKPCARFAHTQNFCEQEASKVSKYPPCAQKKKPWPTLTPVTSHGYQHRHRHLPQVPTPTPKPTPTLVSSSCRCRSFPVVCRERSLVPVASIRFDSRRVRFDSLDSIYFLKNFDSIRFDSRWCSIRFDRFDSISARWPIFSIRFDSIRFFSARKLVFFTRFESIMIKSTVFWYARNAGNMGTQLRLKFMQLAIGLTLNFMTSIRFDLISIDVRFDSISADDRFVRFDSIRFRLEDRFFRFDSIRFDSIRIESTVPWSFVVDVDIFEALVFYTVMKNFWSLAGSRQVAAGTHRTPAPARSRRAAPNWDYWIRFNIIININKLF